MNSDLTTDQYRKYLTKEITETIAAGYRAAIGMSGKAYIDMNYEMVSGDPIAYKTPWYLLGKISEGTASVLVERSHRRNSTGSQL